MNFPFVLLDICLFSVPASDWGQIVSFSCHDMTLSRPPPLTRTPWIMDHWIDHWPLSPWPLMPCFRRLFQLTNWTWELSLPASPAWLSLVRPVSRVPHPGASLLFASSRLPQSAGAQQDIKSVEPHLSPQSRTSRCQSRGSHAPRYRRHASCRLRHQTSQEQSRSPRALGPSLLDAGF